MKPINIFSAFEGISCGKLALDRAKIPVKDYYASEVDKFALQVSRYNYPNIKQLGDITKIQGQDYPCDLLMGGSPCQGFSNAGEKKNFQDERGKLFWEFVRLLEEMQPKWFLLENVRMKKEWQDVISKALNVEPILINSALVSGQNRERLYWTNIPVKGLPEDKGIKLEDILEEGEGYSYNRKEGLIKPIEKSHTLNASDWRGLNRNQTQTAVVKRCVQVGKSPTLTSMGGGHREPKVSEDGVTWRKLSPLECEWLQTLPDNFSQWGVDEKGRLKEISKTQRYKMVGNGWTVDVIAWILSFLK